MIDPILQRISAWFSYRATLQNSHCGGGAWAPILKQVHQQFNPKPRCRSVTQQFMHEEKLHVNAAFVSKYGEGRGMTSTDRMNKRYEVANLLVNTHFKDKIPGLKQRAKEANDQAMREWKVGLGEVAEAEDVDL